MNAGHLIQELALGIVSACLLLCQRSLRLGQRRLRCKHRGNSQSHNDA